MGKSRFFTAVIGGIFFLAFCACSNMNVQNARNDYTNNNYKDAFKKFIRLANQGNDTAQFYLGLMYEKGQGVTQDYALAAQWYGKAAEQGYADAQFSIGLLYYKGQGIIEDFVQAHFWFNVAATSGDTLAQEYRSSVEHEMIPDQIAQAQTLAREWFKKNHK